MTIYTQNSQLGGSCSLYLWGPSIKAAAAAICCSDYSYVLMSLLKMCIQKKDLQALNFTIYSISTLSDPSPPWLSPSLAPG